MNSSPGVNQKIILMGILFISLLFLVEPSFAATAGGGLPFDSWLTKIQKSITGPFAFTASIVGMVTTGTALIFGGDMNGVVKTVLFFALALSFVVAAQTMITAITGKGAEITRSPQSTLMIETRS